MIESPSEVQLAKNIIWNIISNIKPFDFLEKEHIEDSLLWIKSDAPIFRVKKPDIPNKHLVCYFVLFDKDFQKILLVDHIKAGLWIPSGGHVDENEHPRETVIRECSEELSINAELLSENPIFLTSTYVEEENSKHTDVSLWYVLRGDHKQDFEFDRGEFHGIKWYSFDEITALKTDPHMHRFIAKLRNLSEVL